MPAVSLHPKAVVLTLVVIISNVAGNLALSYGMRKGGPDVLASPVGYIQALFDPWVTAGVILLVLWMLSQMALLSWADLSYVMPVTSVGYALSAVCGRLFLNEQISPARWAGVMLIMMGVFLVGRTQHNTTPDNVSGEADQ